MSDLYPFPHTLAGLGRRICIIGISNAGKSTLAQTLADKTGIPVTHLDQIAHIPHTDWVRRPEADFIADHDATIAKDEWIIEGNYSRVHMAERFAHATAVIWLDMGFWGFLRRYILRSLKSHIHRPGRLEGATGEFSWNLIHYSWKHYPENREKYKDIIARNKTPDTPLIVIRSMRDLNRAYTRWDLSPPV